MSGDFSDRLAELMRGAAGTTDASAEPAEAAPVADLEEAVAAPAVAPSPPPAPMTSSPTVPATTPASAGGGSHRDQPPGKTPDAAQVRTPAPKKRGPSKGRFDDLKESVHEELLVQLGPKLYDANLSPTELEAMVRQALADVMAASDRPLTSTDRQRITQEIADDILGYGPIEPYLRDDTVSEVMVNGPFDIWLERKGRLVRVEAKFNDEAHLRRTIDKIVSRIGRRIDGRRAPPGRKPCERRRTAAGDRRQLAHDPEVLPRPADGRGPDRLRHDLAQDRRLPRRVCPGPAQRRRLGRYRCRKDDDAERAVILHPQ